MRVQKGKMEVIVKYKGWLDSYRDTYMLLLCIKQCLLSTLT